MSSHKKATEMKFEEPQDITNAVKKTTQEVWYFIYASNVMIFRKPSAHTTDRPGIRKIMVKSAVRVRWWPLNKTQRKGIKGALKDFIALKMVHCTE
jgi:hypothetical protein